MTDDEILQAEEQLANQEAQTTFNEDGLDELCTDDTVIENAEEVE